MSTEASPTTNRIYGIERVCRACCIPRSSFYHFKSQKDIEFTKRKRGPKPAVSDTNLLGMIRRAIRRSPFTGEGHRKIHARICRRYPLRAGRNRILRLMREKKLLSPHRSVFKKTKAHDGKIVTDSPNEVWATDAVKLWTEKDGWIWYFGVTDHWNSECLGWHVAKRGDRFAAIEALRQAIRNEYVKIQPEAARGVKLRPDHGSVFTSEAYRQEAKYLGFSFSYALVGEPETNGVEERFHRTLKEQCIHGREFKNIEEVREAIGEFVKNYNEHWLLEKLNYRSPQQARREWNSKEGFAIAA
jgi:putative transposase